MDLEPVLRTAQRSQGVVTWGQLLSEHPRRRIEAAVDAGLLVRVGRGRLSLPSTPDPLRQALVHRGVVSHAAAARLWFLETLHDPVATDITVPRRATSRPVASGTRLHWTDLRADEVRGRVTGPLRTVVDCARTMSFPDALTVADSALRRRAVEKDELVQAAAAVRGPGAAAARQVADAADHRAMSPLESGLRGIVVERGLTGFGLQVPFCTTRLSGFVDLGDPVRRIALEAEGYEFHGSRTAFDRDCRRYDELVRTGWLVLRFSWEQVMYDQTWVADTVEDVLRLRGRVPDRRNRRPVGAVMPL